MSKTGLTWYKREPIAYLGGVQGMTCREHAVYSVVLDLIYVHGGALNNDPKFIAGYFSDMGSAAVRAALKSLIERGKLVIEDGRLTQKRAKNEVKTREKLSENAVKTGKKGGEKSAKMRAGISKNNKLDQGFPQNEIQPDKRREEYRDTLDTSSLRSEVSNVSARDGESSRPKKRDSADELFDEFWNTWPLPKRDRKKAHAAFKRLSFADQLSAIAEAPGWAKAWRASCPTATPLHPTTYLNGKRWEDEFDKTNVTPLRQRPQYGDTRTTRDGRRQVYINDVDQWVEDYG